MPVYTPDIDGCPSLRSHHTTNHMEQEGLRFERRLVHHARLGHDNRRYLFIDQLLVVYVYDSILASITQTTLYRCLQYSNNLTFLLLQ